MDKLTNSWEIFRDKVILIGSALTENGSLNIRKTENALRCLKKELLKEQEEMPFRCKTCAKHTENGICRRWMQEVKDDDYCSFGERI